jgi:hypothetical protein
LREEKRKFTIKKKIKQTQPITDITDINQRNINTDKMSQSFSLWENKNNTRAAKINSGKVSRLKKNTYTKTKNIWTAENNVQTSIT